MEDLTIEHLRGVIAAKVGRDTIPNAAWDVLAGKGHVQDYLGGQITEERLVEYARALAFYADLVGQAEAPRDAGVERQRELDSPRFSGYEHQRSETLAQFLELQVAADADVLQWRRNCWGSPTPRTPEEAYLLVEDPEVRRDLSGVRDVDANIIRPVDHLCFFTRQTGEPERVEYYEGSLLARLHDVSKKLMEELFPRWTQAEASWVVVTGEVRGAPPCLVGEAELFANEHLSSGIISLRVEPWIAADTVLQTYQYLQALTLGRKPRSISERNLEMSKFVMNRLRNLVVHGILDEADLERISWRRLMIQWNTSYPAWAYEDERRFYRDCHRTIRAVVRPYDAIPSASGHSNLSAKVSVP